MPCDVPTTIPFVSSHHAAIELSKLLAVELFERLASRRSFPVRIFHPRRRPSDPPRNTCRSSEEIAPRIPTTTLLTCPPNCFTTPAGNRMSHRATLPSIPAVRTLGAVDAPYPFKGLSQVIPEPVFKEHSDLPRAPRLFLERTLPPDCFLFDCTCRGRVQRMS